MSRSFPLYRRFFQHRRFFRRFIAASACVLIAACTGAPKQEDTPPPPVIFVHGNGDSAALWLTTLWRFESNGWPRERLFALDAAYPLARADDAKPQEGRTGSAEHMAQLAAEVERVRKLTGAPRVALVGNSRGGYAIRNYIRNGGGATTISHAVLGGAPNHGVWSTREYQPGSEFNGTGPFLTALNSPQGPGGLEVTPGVAFMTLRSDGLDKFAQPEGGWIGQPKLKTNVTQDGPALRGAENVVLAGRDHRETSYDAEAFASTYRFIAGRPGRTDIEPEPAPVLNGKITGFRGNDPTNLPLAGAAIEVYEVSPQTGERLGAPLLAKSVGADGLWGPLVARPNAYYEFVIQAEGFAVTHIYRWPFPRSSDLVHMRPVRLAEADRIPGSSIAMSRPRGYFGVGRDRMSLDGISPPPGLSPGVPGVSLSRIRINEEKIRSVVAEFNGERIVVLSWPAQDNHAVIAEFHY
jgi:pimeloyl-ACP methyl ester carboxylesterase